MDIPTLKKLVRQGEGQYLEFKLKATHPEKILKEFVAFANSEGGTLLIGVRDDLLIEGLKFPDEDEFLLSRAVERYCFPPIPYEIERVFLEDSEKEILIFTIPKSDNSPHYVLANSELPENKAFVRVGDRCVQASKEMRQILKERKKEKKSFSFHYGEKENILLKYLHTNTQITLNKFAEIANINKNIASRTLVLLVLTNVLKIYPDEMEDVFKNV